MNVEDALRYATCCGLQNVLVLDAVSGIKSWAQTTQMLENNMPMIDANISSDGWNFSQEHRLWSGPNDTLSD